MIFCQFSKNIWTQAGPVPQMLLLELSSLCCQVDHPIDALFPCLKGHKNPLFSLESIPTIGDSSCAGLPCQNEPCSPCSPVYYSDDFQGVKVFTLVKFSFVIFFRGLSVQQFALGISKISLFSCKRSSSRIYNVWCQSVSQSVSQSGPCANSPSTF